MVCACAHASPSHFRSRTIPLTASAPAPQCETPAARPRANRTCGRRDRRRASRGRTGKSRQLVEDDLRGKIRRGEIEQAVADQQFHFRIEREDLPQLRTPTRPAAAEIPSPVHAAVEQMIRSVRPPVQLARGRDRPQHSSAAPSANRRRDRRNGRSSNPDRDRSPTPRRHSVRSPGRCCGRTPCGIRRLRTARRACGSRPDRCRSTPPPCRRAGGWPRCPPAP